MELNDVWEKYFDVFVRRAQRRFGLDRAIAEDIVQDVAIEAINRWETFIDEIHFRNWAFKVIGHRSLDYFSNNLPFSLTENIEDVSSKPQYSNRKNKFLEAVRLIILQLPKRQLEVLERLNADCTVAEIAEDMGVKASTVRSLKRHALSFIKANTEKLKEEN